MMIVDLINNDPDKRFATYQRMATAIVDITCERGECVPADLMKRGFDRQEVLDRWHMANSMAAVELKLMDSQSAILKKRA